MLFNKSRSRRPHFGGLRHGYCENRDCPTRNVFYSVKRDPNPGAAAVCPRCQRTLTLSRWCQPPERRLAEMSWKATR